MFSKWFCLIILNIPIWIFEGSLRFETKSWKNPKVACHVISCLCMQSYAEYYYQISESNSPGVSSHHIENQWECHLILPASSSCHAKCEPSVGWCACCASCSTTLISLSLWVPFWSVQLFFSVFQSIVHHYIETYWCIYVCMCVHT
jgi:hypothetical protein